MDNFKIVVFIMAILISLTALANKRKLPYPILLVFAGLIIGFIPGLPGIVIAFIDPVVKSKLHHGEADEEKRLNYICTPVPFIL